jgi:serine/threonine protein phosphatase PrpC
VSDAGLRCTSCGEEIVPADTFCEACGATLRTLPIPEPSTRTKLCVACHGMVGPDGYCIDCGRKQPAHRDHLTIDLAELGGAVTDRGKRHHRNEDAMAFGALANGMRVVVVCDGVSSSARSDEASQAAVDAAYELLDVELIAEHGAESALVAAAEAAQAAVAAIGVVVSAEPPSCTFVAAVVTADDSSVMVAWLGDSRAYLVVNDAATALTKDDSWAMEAVAAGLVTVDEAMADTRAHQITRWLGLDNPSSVPSIVTIPLKQVGLLIVCSDGLWNYLSADAHLAELVGKQADRSGVALAQDLCVFANECGGQDNITVAVLPLRPTLGAAS